MEMEEWDMDDYKIIDVDVHNEQDDRASLPYLQEPWRSRVAASGIGYAGSGYYSPIGVMKKTRSLRVEAKPAPIPII